MLTARGHGEAKKLLEPKGIRVSALRKQEYDPDTGEVLSSGYDDYAAAVTSTAAELHRAGIGHLLGFETEVPHRFGSGYVQRADLVMRAPSSGVPVLSLEIDRRTEDAHELVHKLHRYWEWGVCWRRTSTSTPWIWSAPGPARSRTSATRSGCGGGSTRRPAEQQTRMRLHGV